MKCYVIDNNEIAKNFKQLLKLNAECAKLQWSKTLTNLPQNVNESLSILQEFTEMKIEEECNQTSFVGELSEDIEDMLFKLFRKSNLLKDTLGVGVILSGNEAVDVLEELKKNNVPNSFLQLIKTDKNFIMI